MKTSVKILLSAYILAHLTMVVTSGLPDRSVLGQRIVTLFSPYQQLFGLDQPWSMFAPNPSSVNSYIGAEIIFTDGSSEQWTFPRSSRLDPWERFLSGEKLRKYSQENLVPSQKTEMWRDLGRFLERQISAIESQGRQRHIREIQFYKYTNTVKAPSQEFIPHGTLSAQFERQAGYTYESQSHR